MVRLKGLEPPTHCLEGSCSIHLSYRRVLERVMGIEPTRPAWKAGILPLNYTRMGARHYKCQLAKDTTFRGFCQDILQKNSFWVSVYHREEV